MLFVGGAQSVRLPYLRSRDCVYYGTKLVFPFIDTPSIYLQIKLTPAAGSVNTASNKYPAFMFLFVPAHYGIKSSSVAEM